MKNHTQKKSTFKNLEDNLKKPGKILKTWKKFRKPGENFQKSFGHPELKENSLHSGLASGH